MAALNRPAMDCATFLKIIGDPKRLDAELQQFRKDTELFSSRRNSLLKKYPKRWVAFYHGRVRADSATLDSLLAETDRIGIPRGHIVVQFMETDLRTMIL